MNQRFASPVTALIICKDSADFIAETLSSLDFCAEIVVVDSGSTDGTLDIVERYRTDGYPIKLLHNDWPGFARQRRFALEQATQPWCLSVDADEKLDDRLRSAVQGVVAKDDASVSGWYVRRRDRLAGYGPAHPGVLHNRLLRLFRRDRASMDISERVHESYTVTGKTRVIEDGALLHLREVSLAEDIARANTYSSLKASALLDKGIRPNWFKLLLSPPYTFLKFYLLKRYFLCGRAGFDYAATMAIYSHLTEAKLFELSRKA